MTYMPPDAPPPQTMWWDERVRGDEHEIFLLRRLKGILPPHLKQFIHFHYRPREQEIIAIWEQPNLVNLDEMVRGEAKLKLEVIVEHQDTYAEVVQSLCKELAAHALRVMTMSAMKRVRYTNSPPMTLDEFRRRQQ